MFDNTKIYNSNYSNYKFKVQFNLNIFVNFEDLSGYILILSFLFACLAMSNN